ncbi:hypothetical protein Q3G72_026302 [Acer saccharum]|nr:hypothetical protein Q3G72_026302 [Acer saccharum]
MAGSIFCAFRFCGRRNETIHFHVFYTLTADEGGEEVDPGSGADGDTDKEIEVQFESDEDRVNILEGGDKDLET